MSDSGSRFMSGLRSLLVPERADLEGKSSLVITKPGFTSVTDMRADVVTYGGGTRADGWDLNTVVVSGYERSVWSYRCIETISGHQSRLPFRFGKNIGTDQEEILDDHPLYRVMNDRANPLELAMQMRWRLSGQLLMSKKGVFLEMTRSRLGTITRIDLLHPDRMTIVRDRDDKYVDYYEYTTRNGQVVELAPEKVRWIRFPHPTDEFSGTTPLEAAGLSLDLDFLSRYHNVSFIKNDARPGGVLAVDHSSLTDQESDRIERKLRPGAAHAGEVAVIATGPGGIQYIDTTTRPRDMSYAEASRNAKVEVLTAFGIGESVVGSSEGRTFDNSDQELYNYWTQTMPPHLAAIACAFVDDAPPGWTPFFSTEAIEVLQIPRRRDREEARTEFNAGLRSIDEYRPLAGLRPVNTPQARALWANPSKAPLPTVPSDAAALGLEDPSQAQPGTGEGDAAAAVREASESGVNLPGEVPPPPGSAAEAVVEASAGEDGGTPGEAADAVAEARAGSDGDAGAAVAAALEGKAADPGLAVTPDEKSTAALEAAVAGAITAILARQVGVAVARIESPKVRAGTKFWTGEPSDPRTGDSDIDPEKVLVDERWTEEVVNDLNQIVPPAAVAEALRVLAELEAAGMIASTVAPPTVQAVAAAGVGHGVLSAINVASDIVAGFMGRVRDMLAARSRTATTTTELVDAVKAYYQDHAGEVASRCAVNVAHLAMNGALNGVMGMLAPAPGSVRADIVREWNTQNDTRVRDAHRKVAGQTRPMGSPFLVGVEKFPLRFPQDPLGPLDLTAGCRCYLTYRFPPGARYIVPAEK